MTTPFVRREPYAPRNHRFSGMLRHAGWTLRRHDITPGPVPMEIPAATYAPGESLALSFLPTPAETRDRPGIGFLIRHPGLNQHYIILAWWDQQNELIARVLVRPTVPDGVWEDALGRYSFCVWDLEVFTRERERYVQYVLTPEEGPQIARYLAD